MTYRYKDFEIEVNESCDPKFGNGITGLLINNAHLKTNVVSVFFFIFCVRAIN